MSHSHEHGPVHYGRAFAVGILLNISFVLIEAFYGWQAHSLALIADAGHNLSDVAGLLLAWAAYGASRLHPDVRHTYGWRRASILASFINAVVLLVAMGSLGWEALERLQSASPISAVTVMAVASVGVVVNAVTAWLFFSGSKTDLNIRGAFLHMAADALVSIGVVVAGGLYLWKGWAWIDPVMSLVIALVVVIGTFSLFRKSLHLLMDGVPDDISLDEIHQNLLKLPGVISVHDLHVWAMGTTENSLTAHLVVHEDFHGGDELLHQAVDLLHEKFEIRHATLQCESIGYAECCPVIGGACERH